MKKLSMLLLLATTCLVLTSSKEATTLRLPTTLQVTVLDDIGNVQKNAKVSLYTNAKHHEIKKHQIAGPLKTDAKGRVTFKKLKPIPYYIHAEKGSKDNTLGAIKVGKLKKGKINKINVIISDF